MDNSNRQNAFSKEEILASSRGELFGPERARLPAPNMLMLDRITLISDQGGSYGKGQLVAELDMERVVPRSVASGGTRLA